MVWDFCLVRPPMSIKKACLWVIVHNDFLKCLFLYLFTSLWPSLPDWVAAAREFALQGAQGKRAHPHQLQEAGGGAQGPGWEGQQTGTVQRHARSQAAHLLAGLWFLCSSARVLIAPDLHFLNHSEGSDADGGAERSGPEQQPQHRKRRGEARPFCWRGLEGNQGGHRSQKQGGGTEARGCCCCCCLFMSDAFSPLCAPLQEIVRRFSSQKETRRLYLRLEEENEKVLQQLKEQMDLLNAELQDLRSTGETSRSRWDRPFGGKLLRCVAV